MNLPIDLPFNLSLVLDLILAGILLIFFFVGRGRGLFKSIMNIVKNIVAFVGALIGSRILEPKVTELMLPLFKRKMVNRVLDLIPVKPGDLQIPEAELDFSGLGIDLNTVNQYLDAVRSNANRSLMSGTNEIYTKLADSIEDAAAGLLSNAVRGVLFIMLFFVLLILLSIIVGILENIFELPVINTFNKMGGALLGLLQGILTVSLVFYVLRLTGIQLFEDLADSTVLVNFFYDHTPFEVFGFLKNNLSKVPKLAADAAGALGDAVTDAAETLVK